MPKKIRELKKMLRDAGFISRPGKGSHTVWKHPLTRLRVVLSGQDGDDASRYHEKDVIKAVEEIKRSS